MNLTLFVVCLLLDDDECTLLSHDCHLYADCMNIPGSFNCTCKPGYNGTGVLCDGRIYMYIYTHYSSNSHWNNSINLRSKISQGITMCHNKQCYAMTVFLLLCLIHPSRPAQLWAKIRVHLPHLYFEGHEIEMPTGALEPILLLISISKFLLFSNVKWNLPHLNFWFLTFNPLKPSKIG